MTRLYGLHNGEYWYIWNATIFYTPHLEVAKAFEKTLSVLPGDEGFKVRLIGYDGEPVKTAEEMFQGADGTPVETAGEAARMITGGPVPASSGTAAERNTGYVDDGDRTCKKCGAELVQLVPEDTFDASGDVSAWLVCPKCGE